MPARSDAADWRDRMGAAPTDLPYAQLGLLFQLRTLTREGSQWTAPKAEAATSVRSDRM